MILFCRPNSLIYTVLCPRLNCSKPIPFTAVQLPVYLFLFYWSTQYFFHFQGVLGVAPSDMAHYQPNPMGLFACLDGQMSISWISVNDDFCDCADGSDEPGTGACQNTKYDYIICISWAICQWVSHTHAHARTHTHKIISRRIYIPPPPRKVTGYSKGGEEEGQKPCLERKCTLCELLKQNWNDFCVVPENTPHAG